MNSRFWRCLLVSVFTWGCVTTQAPVKTADSANDVKKQPEAVSTDQFGAAVSTFEAGKLEEARQGFEKVVARDPKNVPAKYNLGLIAERQGRLADAQKAYQEVLKLDPSHRASLLNLGKVYRLQEKFKEAITLYEEALKAPGAEFDVALLNNLSIAYRLTQKYDKAEAALRKVLSRTKDNPDAYKNLALIYLDQGKYRLAEFVSTQAKKLDDKDPAVYNNLGLIYLKLDDRRAALAHFQKAVQLSDSFAPGYVNLGAMALKYRDYENAEKSFTKALAIDPHSYDALLSYAWALDGQKGKDAKKGIAAGDVFERIVQAKGETPEAICGAGWAFAADRAGWDKALKYLDRCKALSGTSPQEGMQIDAKMKSIVAMQKQAPPAKVTAEKPKANAKGAALLDKVAEEGAKEAAPTGVAPAPEQKPAQ